MKNLAQTPVLENKNGIICIFKGIGISYILTFLLLFIFSILLTYTSLGENVIAPVILVITAISILIGSSISSSQIRKKGIVNGGIIGFSYIIMLYIISSLCGNGFGLNLYAILMIVFSIFAGMIGGIVGVNLKK